MKNKSAIGIFDSGVGGTSIWKEINALLPNENTIYLADSANAPYGNKTQEEIIALCIKNTKKLIALGCKVIVVACNTATTNAITVLRETFDIPFIGIEPAIKPAALATKTKSIGILATRGTLSSALFHQTATKFTENIHLVEVIGEGLVHLIEDGAIRSSKLRQLLQSYVAPMIEAKCDFIVLGCSHYPYLVPLLKELLPPNIKIIDSGIAVAKQTKKILKQNGWLYRANKDPYYTFITNTSKNTIEELLCEYSTIEIREMQF